MVKMFKGEFGTIPIWPQRDRDIRVGLDVDGTVGSNVSDRTDYAIVLYIMGWPEDIGFIITISRKIKNLKNIKNIQYPDIQPKGMIESS